MTADVDQDSSGIDRDRAEEFSFTLYDDIAEALCCGGDQLAVDAVLIIGECVLPCTLVILCTPLGCVRALG